jgi:hypothetical protein
MHTSGVNPGISGSRDPGHFPSGFNLGIQDRDPDFKTAKIRATASVI